MSAQFQTHSKAKYRLRLEGCAETDWLMCLKLFREHALPLQSLLLMTLHSETLVEIDFCLILLNSQALALQGEDTFLLQLESQLNRVSSIKWSIRQL